MCSALLRMPKRAMPSQFQSCPFDRVRHTLSPLCEYIQQDCRSGCCLCCWQGENRLCWQHRLTGANAISSCIVTANAVLFKQSRLRATVQVKLCCLYFAICKTQASPQQGLGCTSLLLHLLVIGGANDLQQLRHQSCRHHFILRKAWQYQLQQSPVALLANIARLT